MSKINDKNRYLENAKYTMYIKIALYKKQDMIII